MYLTHYSCSYGDLQRPLGALLFALLQPFMQRVRMYTPRAPKNDRGQALMIDEIVNSRATDS